MQGFSSEGYTGRHTAEWLRLVGWGAALRSLVGILPASFAGRLLIFRSHDRDRQTLYSSEKEQNKNSHLHLQSSQAKDDVFCLVCGIFEVVINPIRCQLSDS